MTTAQTIAMIATGVMFLSALLTGVWKWRHMLNNANHCAPAYVDIAHRSSLMYSFAGILVWHFSGWSAWPEWLNVFAASALLSYFMIAITTYILLGIKNETDNQFSERNFNTTWGMVSLLVAEIGGFVILFSGAIKGLL